MHLLLWMSFITLPHKSGYVVYSYSFNLMFILISLEISLWLLDYLHCVISKCFREFSVIFLLLIFYFDSVVFQEHTVYYFSSFKYVELYFMAQDMVYLGICSKSTWKKSSPCCHWSEYSVLSVRSCWLMVVCSTSLLIFSLVVLQLLTEFPAELNLQLYICCTSLLRLL